MLEGLLGEGQGEGAEEGQKVVPWLGELGGVDEEAELAPVGIKVGHCRSFH